jgi:hypothetical protein
LGVSENHRVRGRNWVVNVAGCRRCGSCAARRRGGRS